MTDHTVLDTTIHEPPMTAGEVDLDTLRQAVQRSTAQELAIRRSASYGIGF